MSNKLEEQLELFAKEDQQRLDSINGTLEKRGKSYGSFEDNANLSQALMNIVKNAPGSENLHNSHLSALDMIFMKIARMVNGDPMHADNPHDIAGYAKLLENYVKQEGIK